MNMQKIEIVDLNFFRKRLEKHFQISTTIATNIIYVEIAIEKENQEVKLFNILSGFARALLQRREASGHIIRRFSGREAGRSAQSKFTGHRSEVRGGCVGAGLTVNTNSGFTRGPVRTVGVLIGEVVLRGRAKRVGVSDFKVGRESDGARAFPAGIEKIST